MKTGELAQPLVHPASQINAEELALVVKTGESWQTDQPCNYPGPEPRLCVAHPNIHPICDLLEHVKGPVLQTQSYRISTI